MAVMHVCPWERLLKPCGRRLHPIASCARRLGQPQLPLLLGQITIHYDHGDYVVKAINALVAPSCQQGLKLDVCYGISIERLQGSCRCKWRRLKPIWKAGRYIHCCLRFELGPQCVI